VKPAEGTANPLIACHILLQEVFWAMSSVTICVFFNGLYFWTLFCINLEILFRVLIFFTKIYVNFQIFLHILYFWKNYQMSYIYTKIRPSYVNDWFDFCLLIFLSIKIFVLSNSYINQTRPNTSKYSNKKFNLIFQMYKILIQLQLFNLLI